MTFTRTVFSALALSTFLACGLGQNLPPARGLVNGTTLPTVTGPNVLQLTVNGSTCLPLPDANDANGSDVTFNEPCVSVTVCPPGADSSDSRCQVIDGLLLDTGSVGLRVFRSALGAPLVDAMTEVSLNGGVQTECITYGDGSADWGPVGNATVYMAGEAGANVPIQIIDPAYGGSGANDGYQICNTQAGGSAGDFVLDCAPSGNCTLPAGITQSPPPIGVGYNGIIGVGLFRQDCGADCESTNPEVNLQMYFTCTGDLTSATTCNGAFQPVSVANQVSNPAAFLPQDNNGVVVELPSLANGFASSTDGYLIFGVGTQTNNQPSGVVSFAVDPSFGEFAATFNGTVYASFIDTGSSLYYLPPGPDTSGLVDCKTYDPAGYSGQGFYCPEGNGTSNVGLTPIVISASGSPTATIPVNVGNPINLFSLANAWVFDNLANSMALFGGNQGGFVDFGLPFYLGRNVYHGFEGASSSLGSGTYWAF